MTYAPRPDSIADRAHQALSARGELSGSALADAIDLDDWRTLRPSLTVAVEHGYIKRVLRNGLNYYSVGDGVPIKAVQVDGEIDDDPVVQRVVPAAPKAPQPTKARKLPTLKPVQTPVTLQTSFGRAVFGRYTDGRLVIEQCGLRIELNRDEAKELAELMGGAV